MKRLIFLMATAMAVLVGGAASADEIKHCQLIDKGGYFNLADPDCANDISGDGHIIVPVLEPEAPCKGADCGPTDPVDPPTDPVDPPTDPVDPPTDPVDDGGDHGGNPCGGNCGNGGGNGGGNGTGNEGGGHGHGHGHGHD